MKGKGYSDAWSYHCWVISNVGDLRLTTFAWSLDADA